MSESVMDSMKTNGLDTDSREYVSSLPKSIKRRVQALKKLQVEGIRIEAQFYERVHQLEVEFAPYFNALHAKRKAIISGEHEPTDEEANFPILHGCSAEETEQINESTAPEPPNPTKGIPNFWLQLMKNVEHIAEMIQEYDEPILKHLIDITCEVKTNPNSYTITFHFEPNEYFTQTELKKWYLLQVSPDEDDIFDYDGPVVIDTKGTEIHWAEGKNVTKKVIKKKQKKGAGGGASRYITKLVRADSFFNFFDPPTVKSKEVNENDDPDEQDLVQADFEIGQLFRDQIVPRAVLFYTGESSAEDTDLFDYDEPDEDDVETDLGDESDNA